MSQEERQKFRSGGYRNHATSNEKQAMIGKIEQTISSGKSQKGTKLDEKQLEKLVTSVQKSNRFCGIVLSFVH